jgi:hypothetical protein
VARGDRIAAGVEDRKVASALGRFHHAECKTALADQRCLLVAGVAADRNRTTRPPVMPLELDRPVNEFRKALEFLPKLD